jgi:hypothetical protein
VRKGHEPKIISENGQDIGICLSADYCAEHEWGINHLKDSLGIPKQDDTFYRTPQRLRSVGLERRKNTKYFKNLLVLEERAKDSLVLGYGSSFRSWTDEKKEYVPYDLKRVFPGSEPLVAAWDESGFFIGSSGKTPDAERTKVTMKNIHQAIKDNNIILFMGGGGVFENPGLCIIIADKLPQKQAEEFKQGDEERLKLEDEALATGIYDKLKEAKKNFYALSPSRSKDGSLIFWLNPQEQHLNNCGWYLLEDLEDWINGKGRIPIRGK